MTSKEVKIDNSKSRFESKKQLKQQFEESVKEISESSNEKKIKGMKLSASFIEILKSGTLQENKGPIEKNVEQDVLKQILDFSNELNNDPSEPEGLGSVAVSAILLKSVLLLRDKVNELSHELDLLKNK